MKKPHNLKKLRHTVHSDLDISAFRELFIKAAWKTYSASHLKSDIQLKELFGELCDILFTTEHTRLKNVVAKIRFYFDTDDSFERFINNTCYMILNFYVKSFYTGKSDGWSKIAAFATTVEELISHILNPNNNIAFLFEATLIDAIETIRRQEKSLHVLNTYLGVPIHYPARVIHTDEESIIIETHPIQEKAALLQNSIYLLKTNDLITDVFASVSPIDINGRNYLRVYRFEQLHNSLFHRQTIRVRPFHPLRFTILCPDKQETTCYAYDISLGGVALTSMHSYEINCHDLILEFPLEIIGSHNRIKAKMVFKSSYESGYKYHFQIDPTLQQEGEIGKYVTRREQEIIKALRDQII
jgi:hypothetical protein